MVHTLTAPVNLCTQIEDCKVKQDSFVFKIISHKFSVLL